MANTSTIDELQSLGLEPKSAAAINKAIDKAVDKALRSSPTTERRPPSSTRNADWQAIGTAIAAVGVILGFVYWQSSLLRDYMNAEIGSVRTEIGSLKAEVEGVKAEVGSLKAEVGSVQAGIESLRDDMRAEFQNVRSDMRAEIGSVREEVNALRGQVSTLGERTARLEAVIQEGLLASP